MSLKFHYPVVPSLPNVKQPQTICQQHRPVFARHGAGVPFFTRLLVVLVQPTPIAYSKRHAHLLQPQRQQPHRHRRQLYLANRYHLLQVNRWMNAHQPV